MMSSQNKVVAVSIKCKEYMQAILIIELTNVYYSFHPLNVGLKIERNVRWFLCVWLRNYINDIFCDREREKHRIGS